MLALPSLADKSAGVRAIFGDWELGTIVQASSGHPVTVFDGDIPDLVNGISGTGLTANQRPNLVSGADCNSSGGLKEQFLNPAAFTLVGIPFGTFGNSPRGVCLGPGFFQTDLAFYKNIPLGGHVQGQFRIEIFNVFNRVNFTGVDTSAEPDRRHLQHRRPVHGDLDHGVHAVGVVRAGAGHPRSEAGAVRLQDHVLNALLSRECSSRVTHGVAASPPRPSRSWCGGNRLQRRRRPRLRWSRLLPRCAALSSVCRRDSILRPKLATARRSPMPGG